MNILDKLSEASAARVAADKRIRPTFDHFPAALPFAFENALKSKEISFICEVKKASPSKGTIAESFQYEQIAVDYEKAGAACLSVLTEPDYFFGKDEYLTKIKQRVSIPVLRKDFTVDEYQIVQARALGADAVLLICTLLEKAQIREYIQIADSLGLSALVETHDENEVEAALEAGARLIGVNNRNLKTFKVDLQNSIRLRKLVPSSVLFVSESGIATRADVTALEKNGVDGVLIGETLMRSHDKKAALDQLRGMADETTQLKNVLKPLQKMADRTAQPKNVTNPLQEVADTTTQPKNVTNSPQEVADRTAQPKNVTNSPQEVADRTTQPKNVTNSPQEVADRTTQPKNVTNPLQKVADEITQSKNTLNPLRKMADETVQSENVLNQLRGCSNDEN